MAPSAEHTPMLDGQTYVNGDDERSCQSGHSDVNGLHRFGTLHKDVQLYRANTGLLRKRLAPLYSESVTAKIWNIAARSLDQVSPPTSHPEYTAPGSSEYTYSSHEFWTSGFFPGSLAVLYQRRCLYSQHEVLANQHSPHVLKLQHACRWWSDALHSQAARRDTHDLGFMIQPWAQVLWELDGDRKALASLVAAAYSLASRFDDKVKAIRSWDTCFTKRYRFADPYQDFLVIVDSMMSKPKVSRRLVLAATNRGRTDLNLLYYVARELHDENLFKVATCHATTLMQSHVRQDNSTYHVVNFDPSHGSIKQHLTNQGYSEDSCWARGQAWALAGYAQTYGWTRDTQFLDLSCRLADHFLSQLPEDSVPYWDFHAPRPGPRDTSAAMIAVYGMLLLHQHLQGSTDRFLHAALEVLQGVLTTSMAPEAEFQGLGSDGLATANRGEETVLLHATINNYEFAPRRWADHGLVYADYYFLLVGNELLRMGLV
ncbi:uncharacterized protein LTR77_004631 [Saxophila tyrrhenica]|uniref:Glucuronyl hydrolase n=1 Tax=Saxophila tyrrhenica TaxID=1690608 RepID=A0AAV9PE16_9PEZI|nr:hypothetical protein LTR77_004631 [Saxophila tyrrhenica]